MWTTEINYWISDPLRTPEFIPAFFFFFFFLVGSELIICLVYGLVLVFVFVLFCFDCLFYFILFFVVFLPLSCVLCTQCCQCLWIVHFYLSLLFSLMFIWRNITSYGYKKEIWKTEANIQTSLLYWNCRERKTQKVE